jgi:glycosyltransferase involved in cell wall biosynthesis
VPAIPRIIHQTWKDTAVPAVLAGHAQSWRRHHPGWMYRFWDDAALRLIVAERHPGLLPVFDGYAHAICRVDLARYVIMEAIGGIYADLDFECLAPNDALIGAHELLIGLEPDAHLMVTAVQARGVKRLLSPAWIASVPGHPFWRAVLDEVARRAHETDPLIATGPILLSEVAARWRGRPALALVEAALLHPLDKQTCERGDAFDLQRWQLATGQAFAVHHWSGTWWRDAASVDELGEARAVLCAPGHAAATLSCRLRAGSDVAAMPLVSGLMVTSGRPALAARAIACFLAQTYRHRELVIVDDDADDTLARHVAALGDQRLRLLRLPPEGRSLGALRNLAVAAAQGEFVCQWDDDDLCDPARIECQMQVLREADADACFLSRWMIWWPAGRRLACSNARVWEGSMLVRRNCLTAYPELRRGEDTPVVEQLMATRRVVLLDQPRLYVYAVHGANTFDAAHFEQQWQAATARFDGIAYRRLRQELQKRVDLDAHLTALAATAHATHSGQTSAAPTVSLIAALDNDYGLAVAAASTQAALHAASVDVQSLPLPMTRSQASQAGNATRATAALRIVHTNPEFIQDMLFRPESAARMRELLNASYVIGFWAWESPNTFRREQLQAFAHFDEIWVPSDFVRDALARVAPIPVLTMPHAVQPGNASTDRALWSIPADAFVFMTVFDAFSHFERKNPLAVIAAFREAFDAQQNALLLLKTIRLTSAQREQLDIAIGGDLRIRILDVLMDRQDYLGLLASIDVVISLHRAEGFGLVMAEAMALGKPVIASRYSGNLQFMDERNSLLVDIDPWTLDSADGCYAAGTQWCTPRPEHAARYMRQLYHDPDAAAAMGAAAAQHMAVHFSAAAIGRLMRERIEQIVGKLPVRLSVAPAPPPLRNLGATSRPRVLIATPVRNARGHLQRYAELLSVLAHPRDKLALVMIENGSSDGTADTLMSQKQHYDERFARVVIDASSEGAGEQACARWTPQQQYRRRAATARARNRALQLALGDAEWVLWIDVDVIDYAPSILERMLDTGADVVTPNCVLDRGGPSFDLNTFVRDPAAWREDWTVHACDGLVQPPRGAGRRYLESFRGQRQVRLDSVGATMLLVRADVHRGGVAFPDFSYRGFIETEGFAMLAAERGHSLIGLPDEEVVHFRG